MRQHDHGHHDPQLFESDVMAARIELEGDVLAGLALQATALLRAHCEEAGTEARRVVDLGCGPGVGTAVLAETFPSATVIAADGSAAMLARAEARASRLGIAGRVETREIDLDGDLGTIGRCDVAWASMSLHHMGDLPATLGRVRTLLEPDGLLCVVERADPVAIRFADDLGRPGIWERLDSAWGRWYQATSADRPDSAMAGTVASLLAEAGFDIVVDRTLVATVAAPLDVGARQFAVEHVQKSIDLLDHHADSPDLEAIATLLDPGPIHDVHWATAELHASRLVLVARPGGGGGA